MGVMEKQWDCMHGCESVYIILEQIFCTRNDGARCVISTHLYLCHVIRLVILSTYVLSDRETRETDGRTDGRTGGGLWGEGEEEKKAKRRRMVERGNGRRRVFGYEEI